jgi:UDP-glucose 4-epimerase
MLLDACVGTSIERLVYASSSSVYGDVLPANTAPPSAWNWARTESRDSRLREDGPTRPVSPYGVSKLAAEHLCSLYHSNYDVPSVSLRFFTVYGPRQRPDMAFHKFLLAAHTGQPITLYGDGQQTRDFTYVDDIVTALISAATRGVPGHVYNIGGGTRVTVRQVLHMIERVTGKSLNIVDVGSQKGDMRHTYADTTLARTELGFAPTMDLERGLAAEYAWLLSPPA